MDDREQVDVSLPERRPTGPQHVIVQSGNGALVWKFFSPVIGAAVMGLAVLFWNALRGEITKGKADEATVQVIKAANDEAHTTINNKLNKIDVRTKRDGRVTRAIAKKLKIDVPPEPPANEE
jgi:hypothetical protein